LNFHIFNNFNILRTILFFLILENEKELKCLPQLINFSVKNKTVKYYKKMRIMLIFILLISMSNQCEKAIQNTPEGSNKNYTTIIPQVYEKAFPNPLKGFRSSSLNNEDYPTLTRLYIKWNEIENSENDGIEKILSYCNSRWQDLPKRNVKVIPRVYLEWPYSTQNAANTRDTIVSSSGSKRYCERYWPSDMVRGDYSSDQFKKRVVSLIYKMGKAWDNDPRIAYIEMGLIGWWGEQHSPFISVEMQKLLGDAFISAFKTKLVMVRHAKDFTTYPLGSYWDSFAHVNEANEAILLSALGGKWKSSVRGGELAYDWGDRSRTGTSPDESLKVKNIRDYLIDNIRKLHWNHLGWINNYKAGDPEVKQGADELQKNLGYRFILDEVSYSSNVLPGDTLKVNFSVRNIGSSPFYYNWPIEVSLLNPGTKQAIWKSIFQNIDIRTWIPGDQWDPVLRKYNFETETKMITGVFILPENIQKGEYILALSILDPSGNVPSVRFAIKNYFKGGRHPIGKIGVNKSLSSFDLGESAFDDLYADRTLYYEYK
jgi:hypothetical protein